jgi:hypothetical protein
MIKDMQLRILRSGKGERSSSYTQGGLLGLFDKVEQGIGVEWMSMKTFLAEMALEKCFRESKQTFQVLCIDACKIFIV